MRIPLGFGYVLVVERPKKKKCGCYPDPWHPGWLMLCEKHSKHWRTQ